MLRRFLSLVGLAIGLSAFGCSSTVEDEASDDLGEIGIDEAGLRDRLTFEVFEDDIGFRGRYEERKVFTSDAAYRNYFGHYAPWEVDFYTHWVAFYSAGIQTTGGYDASIQTIETSSSGATIYVKTRLESPGSNCVVTQALTKPYVLVKFKKPWPRPQYVRYTRNDDVLYCTPPRPEPPPPPPTCASTLCMVGTHCVDTPEGAECVPDPCPGAGRRNTTTGRCECRVVGLCQLGTSWNSSPSVCGCE